MHQPSPRIEAPRKPVLSIVPPTTAQGEHEVLSARLLAFVVAAGLLFGALVRLSFVVVADFPLNDGGLFHAMAGDLQRNDYAIPGFTTYNFDGIPFAYPPLGFYVAAVLDDWSPLTMIDILRWLPLLVSVLTMFAFAAFARRILDDRIAIAAAVVAFALNPRSYEWMIMGGGLTRSIGLLFAILTLHEAIRMHSERKVRFVLATGALAGMTALSHIEMAWFVAFSLVLMVAYMGRDWTGLRNTVAVGTLAAAIASPWLFVVLNQHGVSPFIAAMTTGSPSETNPLVAFLVFNATDEPMFALIGALGLLGALVCIARGEWFLPAWVLACGLLDPRGFGNVVCVPLALLAGLAVSRVLLPAFTSEDGGRRRTVLAGVVFGFLALYSLINAMVATPRIMGALSPEERSAMAWVDDNTAPSSQFLVITDDTWNEDRVSEWFPVLAQRRSVATVQGYEWIRGGFGDQLQAYEDAQTCADVGGDCLDQWATAYDLDFDYVYLTNSTHLTAAASAASLACCGALRLSLDADSRYERVYDGDGAAIYRILK